MEDLTSHEHDPTSNGRQTRGRTFRSRRQHAPRTAKEISRHEFVLDLVSHSRPRSLSCSRCRSWRPRNPALPRCSTARTCPVGKEIRRLWSVQDGAITGVTTDGSPLPYNKFLIWRGGTVKNFELRAKVRQTGNNSGIQYRSRELKEVGPGSVGGYQCDIHPLAVNNAMLYDERGRGIVAMNGQSVIVDEKGGKWLTKQRDPVTVDVAEWNEYTIIARGNQLTHKLNGQVTVEIIDHQADHASWRGSSRSRSTTAPRCGSRSRT